MKRPKFRIWYAVWCNVETMLVHLRKTKRGARNLVTDLRADFPEYKFGWKRLIEPLSKPRRRRKRKKRARPS